MAIFKFENTYSKFPDFFYQRVKPEVPSLPKMIYFNKDFATQLGLNLPKDDNLLLSVLSGQILDEGSDPIALAYAGHQFGHFNSRLGDGRAILLGEHINLQNQRLDIQLKGSGRTQYSRNGDGKSALGPALREYLISEAFFHLKIPSTRSLAVLETGSPVFRDRTLPGGLSVRIASSHIRIGSFEFFAAQNDITSVQRLADYSIERHFPELKEQYISNTPEIYLAFLRQVIDRQAQLIAKWMSIGFVHGVMNTDNILVSGESIDFGPCAFIDFYNPKSLFSSIDKNGRYAYNEQPFIMRWNLACFADCLLPLLHSDINKAVKLAAEALNEFTLIYENYWLKIFLQKLGFSKTNLALKNLIDNFLQILSEQRLDFTTTFRNLSYLIEDKSQNALTEQVSNSFFNKHPIGQNWKQMWLNSLIEEPSNFALAKTTIETTNPYLIPRNHVVEFAIQQAVDYQNYDFFLKLTEALKNPFSENIKYQDFAEPPQNPDLNYQTFCGT
jgi:uncharacterized protein YdiU (UPF0061 family)